MVFQQAPQLAIALSQRQFKCQTQETWKNSFSKKSSKLRRVAKTHARGAGKLSPCRIFPFLKGPGRYSARSWFEPVFLLSQCYVVRCPSPICTCWCAYPTLDGSLSFIITFSSVIIPVLSAHSVFVAGHFLLPLGGSPFPRGDHICPTFCPFAVTAAPGDFSFLHVLLLFRHSKPDPLVRLTSHPLAGILSHLGRVPQGGKLREFV